MDNLSHMTLHKTRGGMKVKHMLHGYLQPSQEHDFPMPKDRITLPGGHVLTHIAKHMGIPHMVEGAKEEQMEEKIAPGIHKEVAAMEEQD